jgi:tRNA modification GTPase
MFYGDRESDTICAVSTPHGVGGISVIRLSGSQSLSCIRKICEFIPSTAESHRVYFGTLKNISNRDPIDEVLITFFEEGRSFTGEEVVEISCHGSPIICYNIMQELLLCGARSADRGEFTYRSFMNGKMDLVQAESILSLIESQSKHAAKLAIRQLKGSVSKVLEKIEDDMVWVLAHAEAGIDFSTEGIVVAENSLVLEKLSEIEDALSELVSSFKFGRVLKEGVRVVFAGVPNVGKSSLLNLLLEEDKAIVTEIPGTTRDLISGETSYEGFQFIFSDTAGFRAETADVVEQIGILKGRKAVEEADFVCFIFDSSKVISAEEVSLIKLLDPKKTLLVGNKKDLVGSSYRNEEITLNALKDHFFEDEFNNLELLKSKLLYVCANEPSDRKIIFEKLLGEVVDLKNEDSVLISNVRHFENLRSALDNTRRSREVVVSGLGDEFLALEFKEALISVQETLGKKFDDQIMDRVFKEFCIGK